jgi:hypothetical protein
MDGLLGIIIRKSHVAVAEKGGRYTKCPRGYYSYSQAAHVTSNQGHLKPKERGNESWRKRERERERERRLRRQQNTRKPFKLLLVGSL